MSAESTPPAGGELGAFLRRHREGLTPAAAGLPAGRRRRTPGLRREEVAQLAGLSPTWYAWLEQGRTRSLSPRALAGIADALQLSRAERKHLFDLAERRDPAPPAGTVLPAGLLDSVHHFAAPAYVLDACWNALAWNHAAAALFTGWLDERAEDRNLLRRMFLAPALITLVEDWPHRAGRLVAEFRAHNGSHRESAAAQALVESLQAESTAFRACWEAQTVEEREGGLRAFVHPEYGRQVYRQLTLAPVTAPELLLVTLLPVDASVESAPT